MQKLCNMWKVFLGVQNLVKLKFLVLQLTANATSYGSLTGLTAAMYMLTASKLSNTTLRYNAVLNHTGAKVSS